MQGVWMVHLFQGFAQSSIVDLLGLSTGWAQLRFKKIFRIYVIFCSYKIAVTIVWDSSVVFTAYLGWLDLSLTRLLLNKRTLVLFQYPNLQILTIQFGHVARSDSVIFFGHLNYPHCKMQTRPYKTYFSWHLILFFEIKNQGPIDNASTTKS